MLDIITEELGCSILCITEHWQTKDQLDNYKINNYKKIADYCRGPNLHGGSAVYALPTIPSVEFKDLKTLSEDNVFECASAICSFKNFKCIVISLYRNSSPLLSDIYAFLDKFYLMLTILHEKQLVYFIAGDFNIDTLSNDKPSTDFKNILSDFGATLTIREHTRVTSNTKSCLDNIITNFKGNFEGKVVETGISDHSGQVLNFEVESQVPAQKAETRDFNSGNILNFCNKLGEETWSEVYQSHDINFSFSCFLSIFLHYFHIYFPKIKVRNKKNNKFFLKDPNILEFKQQVVMYQIIAKIDDAYKVAYNESKMHYNKLIVDTKKRYYRNKISLAGNKSKAMWQAINDITRPPNSRTFLQTDDPEDTANNFNHLFVNMAHNLLSQQPLNYTYFYNSLLHNKDRSLFFSPVTPSEILSIIRNMPNKKSTGIDEIPVSILKACAHQIAEPLSHLINLSLEIGIFPDELKIAIVKPLFKKGDFNSLENYRPISLLTCFSKIFEYVVSTRLISFFTKYGLFSDNQHGYLKGRSIDTALFEFINSVLQELEDGNVSCGIFLDLSKAFDCINHEILLNKLHKYGIRGNVHNWFRSYLTGRKQLVELEHRKGKVRSGVLELSAGVPQGSILGPLLFIIFLNDISNIVSNIDQQLIINYADDTNLLIKGQDFMEILETGNSLLKSIKQWFSENNLILNESKTDAILFKTNNSIRTPQDIILDSKKICFSTSVKFLGVHINDTLTWTTHIDYLTSKLSSICYAIRILRDQVDYDVVKTLYYANFYSLIKFGIVTWGSSSELCRIFSCQKRVIRLMLNMKARDTCRGKFKANKFLTVTAIYIYECLQFLVKNRSKFDSCLSTHTYSTRFRGDFTFPIHKRTLYEKGTFYRCLRFYNHLPLNIKNIQCDKMLLAHARNFLCDIEPYSLDEYFSINLNT